jgi:kumamolisin
MFVIPGSKRSPIQGASIATTIHPEERMEVTLVLQPENHLVLADIIAGKSKPLTHDEYAAGHANTNETITKVNQFAQQNHLVVASVNPVAHRVILSGNATNMNAAFGVTLQLYEYGGGTYRGHEEGISIPAELADHVVAVMGLDTRMAAKPRVHRYNPNANIKAHSTTEYAYFPTTVAKLYDFPVSTGINQTIGIIELGGGYKPADLSNYFKYQLGEVAPKITAISISGGLNQPTGDADGPDGEVMLDIEVAGSVAPGANLAVYFCPNTDVGFLNAITTAMHDTTNRTSVISISWGGPEDSWSKQSLAAFNNAFQTAAVLGITVCAASGDNGSSDGETGNHVDFPASSPYVVACGGSSMQASRNVITSEVAWSNSGGGISPTFAAPTWQAGLSNNGTPISNRGSPDVCGDADPNTGYAVRVDGANGVYGGTSAVAPLWAALFARINSIIGSNIGLPHPVLYANPAAFNDIVSGSNSGYKCATGWDAVTGLGSPNGSKLLAAFKLAKGAVA